MARRITAILIAAAALAGAAGTLYESARRKAVQIESEKAPPRSAISFSLAEVNAYAAEEVRKEAPDGVRNPQIELGAGTATGSALIDFAKVQTARGKPPGMLLGWLIRGEREVSVQVAVASAGGKCQIDVKRVQVGGVPLTGAALNLVIDYYVLPRYPDAAIGRPFELRHRVDKVEVVASGVTFRIGK